MLCVKKIKNVDDKKMFYLCIMSWWVYGVVFCRPDMVGRSVPEIPGALFSPSPPLMISIPNYLAIT